MNQFRPFLACALLALTASACSGGGDGGGGDDDDGASTPVLATLSPTSGIVSTAVTVIGTDFGDVQGTGVVRFGAAVATVQGWTDTEIVAVVPDDAFPGNRTVSVQTDIGTSNALDFQVVVPRAVYVWDDQATPSMVQSFSATGTGELAVLGSALTLGATGSAFGGATTGMVFHAPTRRVYASGLGSFAAFDVDPLTGALSGATGSPVTVGTSNDVVYGLAVSSSGNVVWATEYTTCQIHAYAVTPAGLNEIAGSPFLTGDANPCDVVVPSLDGSWLHQNSTADGVSTFSIAADGALTEIGSSPSALPGSVYQFTADPTRDRFYAPATGFGALLVVDVNPSTGAITENASLRVTLAGAGGTALSADGSRLFASVFMSGDIHVYDLNPGTGALTEVPGSPFVTGYTSLSALAVSDDGSVLYAVEDSAFGPADQVAVFGVASTGVLTELAGSPTPLLAGASASTIVTSF